MLKSERLKFYTEFCLGVRIIGALIIEAEDGRIVNQRSQEH